MRALNVEEMNEEDSASGSDQLLKAAGSRVQLVGAASPRRRQQRTLTWSLVGLALLGLTSLLLSIAALSRRPAASTSAGSSSRQRWGQIERLAFGSCTSYDVRPQPIWTEGVIPARPDAWLWLGDFAYFDDPLINCDVVPHHPTCNCSSDWLRRPPFQCFAADVDHARLRAQLQLAIPEYRAFLAYACPGYAASGTDPPTGTDPAICPRPLFGVWDDHDAFGNNCNGHYPNKDALKRIYLDAIGEPRGSPRRSSANGIQAAYTLPGPGTSSSSRPDSSGSRPDDGGSREELVDEVRLILLDERYFRETLPCSEREPWCRRVLSSASSGQAPPQAGDVAWCREFLAGSTGACCTKDDEWEAWCAQPGNAQHTQWTELCDPTSAGFASVPRVLAADNRTVLPVTDDLWDTQQAALWPRLVQGSTSPLCEVLGLQQRSWLARELASSRAALTLVASGSVLAGSLGYVAPDGTTCSGDDLACWRRAQTNLLHTLANASGCVVLLTGDYHYSDLKAILPGASTRYAAALQTARLAKPVYQAMASGMSFSTAEHRDLPCEGSFREDLVGLRPLGRCSYVHHPAFGMVEVDWARRVVSLSIRNATGGGGVAHGLDGSRQLLQFSLESCGAAGVTF